MDSLSPSIPIFPKSTPLHDAGAAGPGPDALKAGAGGALPPTVGQACTGTGPMAGRQLAVGPGENRARAQGAVATIKNLLSGLTNGLWTLVKSPVVLVRSIASYVMRLGAGAPAPRPAAETTPAQRQAIDSFHAQAVVLTGGLATEPVLAQAREVPSGLHSTAVKDWDRPPGVVIEGETYGAARFAGERDVNVAAVKLTEMCKGNAAAAEWISRFANQQMGMPMMQLLFQLPLGPEGESNFLLNDPTLTPKITLLGDGTIEVTMSLDWAARDTPGLYLDPGARFRVHPDSQLTASCSLRFELPADNASQDMPTVSVSKPVEWTSTIRPAPTATEAS